MKKYLVLLIALFSVFSIHCIANIRMAKLHPEFFLHDDGMEYLNGAVSFAENGTIMTGEVRYYEAPRSHDIPEIYRPPLLPLLTGCLNCLFHDPLLSGAILQALHAALLAFAIYLTAEKLSGSKPAGWIAVVLVTFHPLILTFSLRFSSELGFILYLTLFLYWGLQEDSQRKYVLMGAAAALACGMRPTALLLLPAFGVYLLVRHFCRPVFRDSPLPYASHSCRNFLIFASVFLLMLAPWGIRNYSNFGTLSPAGCLGGFNLFVGNNIDNAAAYRTEDGKMFLKHQGDGWNRAIALAKSFPEDLSPVEQDKRFREAAKHEMHEMGLGEFLHMSLMKAWHFIRPWPLYGAHSRCVFWTIALSEILLFLAGGFGIYLLRRKLSVHLFLLMIFCVGWSAHSFVHLQMRHRVPFLDLPLILLAAAGISYLLSALLYKFRSGSKEEKRKGKESGYDLS